MTQIVFPASILKRIFNDSGNLKSLPLVSKAFRDIAYIKALEIFQTLSAEFGETPVRWAFEQLDKKETSGAFQIDLLFERARENAPKRKFPLSPNPYSSLHLVDYMAPFVEAQAVDELFFAIFQEARPSMQEKMVENSWSDDPLERIKLRKKILSKNADELLWIEQLSIQEAGLNCLPKEISLLCNLKRLNLSKNRFQFLPLRICALPNLESIIVDDCHLLSLPQQIGQLKKLKLLSVNGNQLTSLPEEIGDLAELKALSVGYNKLKSLPASIKKLGQLEYLYLYNNQFQELPDALGDLSALKLLSASNNKIKGLPEGFSRLAQLQTLVMSHNLIEVFPPVLRRIPTLRDVHLCKNQMVLMLEDFPPGMCVRTEGNNAIGVLDFDHTARVARSEFSSTYFYLGDSKWKEFFDLSYHPFGPNAFDDQLFSEPGFLDSMLQCVQFLDSIFYRRLDFQDYLQLMKLSVRHIDLSCIGNLIGCEKSGMWRRIDADTPESDLPSKNFSSAAKWEFCALSERIALLFGSSFSLGKVIKNFEDPSTWEIVYYPLTRDQRIILFCFFHSEFVIEMQSAVQKEDIIRAIVRFTKNLEWAHVQNPQFRRADKLLMDFLLTKFGIHPTLMCCSISSHCLGFEEWMKFVMIGLRNWEEEASELEESRKGIDIDEHSDGTLDVGQCLDLDDF